MGPVGGKRLAGRARCPRAALRDRGASRPAPPSTSAPSAAFASATTPELGRVVAADLGGVGVDVNQPRRRNREREARIPRARVRLGEPRADGENQIGVAARVVRDRQCPRSPSGRAAADGPRAGSPCPSACARPARSSASASAASSRGRARRHHAAAGVQHRPLGAGQRRRRCARRSPASMVGRAIGAGTFWNASTGRSAEKMSIGTSTSTGPGRPVCAQVERALHDRAADPRRDRRGRRACRTAGRSANWSASWCRLTS